MIRITQDEAPCGRGCSSCAANEPEPGEGPAHYELAVGIQEEWLRRVELCPACLGLLSTAIAQRKSEEHIASCPDRAAGEPCWNCSASLQILGRDE